MERVLKKSLLVALMVVLCFLPLFMFGGCDGQTDDANMSGYDIEITNVSAINEYHPHENKVWYNQQQQRVRFCVKEEYSYGYSLKMIEIPYSDCKIEYMKKTYYNQTTN